MSVDSLGGATPQATEHSVGTQPNLIDGASIVNLAHKVNDADADRKPAIVCDIAQAF